VDPAAAGPAAPRQPDELTKGVGEDRPAESLARTMGGFGALLITLSNLSPSIGVFVVGSDVLHQAGTSTLLCYLAAALLGVAIANVYAELAAAVPEAGGEYTIVGRLLGPAWGFALLGLNLLTFSIAPAMTALGVVDYLHTLAPGLPTTATAVALVLVCTAVAILNIRVNAWVTGLFLAVELLTLGVVTVLGALHPHERVGALLAHPVVLGGAGVLQSAGVSALGLGAAAAIYAFDGYGSVVYLGEEVRDAPRRMASVVFWALGLAAVFQIAPVFAVLVGSPSLRQLLAAPSPVLAFIGAVGGPGLERAMGLGVALALFNAMIASAVMGGRQLYSSGRDRAWPPRLNQAFAALHPRFASPWIATAVLGVSAALWCLVKLSVLVILIGDGTAAIYLCMCLAALRGRRTTDGPYRMPLFPLLPTLALAGLGAVAVADLFDPAGRAGLLASAVTVGLSVGYYALVARPAGRWRHRGPTAAQPDAAADAQASLYRDRLDSRPPPADERGRAAPRRI
jgi:amino acid transporter